MQGVTREETLDKIQSVRIKALRDYVEHLEKRHEEARTLLKDILDVMESPNRFNEAHFQKRIKSFLEEG